MNFIWLEDFLALAASGSFSRAAETRHSSQPAFSRRIRALEDWLGVPVVDRGSQPVQLTAAGEWLAGVARELVSRSAGLPEQAQRIAAEASSTLRIAATHALSFVFLPQWLRALEAELQPGPISLVSDVFTRCEALLSQGKVQYALGHAHPQAPSTIDETGFESLCVGLDELLAVCKPRPDHTPMFSLDAGDHAEIPLLGYSDESGLGRIVRAILGARLQARPNRSVLTAHLGSVLRSMALEGNGLAWLPRSLIQDDLTQGRLIDAGGSAWRIPLQIRLYRMRTSGNAGPDPLWRAALARSEGLQ